MTPPGLTITATPIGNLDDISPRAVASLTGADLIACEDTRHTGLMLSRLGLKHGRLVSYHDHTSTEAREKLLAELAEGKAVTLVSDAGTPLISDPGYRLVKACRERGIPVTTVPGPSALLAGLVISGLPTDRFYFAGFLPNTSSKRQKTLNQLMTIDATIICYESARRLGDAMADIAEISPLRLCSIARELTKTFEESWHDTAANLAEHFRQEGPPKGELVVMIAPPDDMEKDVGDDAILNLLKEAMAQGASRRDAVRQISTETGVGKSRVYDLMLTLGSS
jgi:16S rRNA (cytidine1402-2'-O)-methyltransferase